MNALQKIRDAGFSVALAGDFFQISPSSDLTQNQRDFLKSHRAEILNELRAETSGLSACDRQKLSAYLDHIEEFDPALRDELLFECGRNPDALAWVLQWADRALKIQNREFTGLAQCSGCAHLTGDTCQLHGWRVVVNNWRECSHKLASQKRQEKA